MELTYDPAIPLMGTYPEKTIIQKDTCAPMFIQHYLQQPGHECPSKEKWKRRCGAYIQWNIIQP